jgi:hypothetical protein
MVSLIGLWLPIIASAVLVFVLSSVIHMLLKYHASDYTKLPNEDAVRAAIRSGSPAPRQYIIPYAAEMKDMQSPEMQQKFKEGPVAVLNIKAPGPMSMGPTMVQWFIFGLVVTFVTAYIASRTLAPGTDFLQVFRVVGTVGWLAYGAGQLPAAIWMGKPWSVAWKEVFDGFLYAMGTAAIFGWLWPH